MMQSKDTQKIGKILVVDDQPLNVKLLKTYLNHEGYEVITASNGQEAIEAASRELPDIILLDIMMPVMDGYEACRRIKKVSDIAAIPVIFLSALTEINEKINAFRCGGVDYITKAFQKEEVLVRVETHLKLRRLQKDLEEKNESLKKTQESLISLNKELEERVREEVSSRMTGQQLLIQQSKMAAMGEMINSIAHQWKQPLSAISMNVEDLDEAFIHNELTRDYLTTSTKQILSQIDFMTKTVDDFRNFLKPSKVKAKFDLKAAVEEILSMFSSMFKKNGIELNLHAIDLAGEYEVVGYPNEFKQVILNLINNAKDAIVSKPVLPCERKKSPTGAIDIELRKEGGRSQVIVRDTGGGIPEEIIERIFDSYFTTKSEEAGTGIGLYMSKTIIENNMGWRLNVKNIEGGAEFKIET